MSDRIIYDPSESDQQSTRDCGSVISLADVRVARGWSRPSKVCGHKSLVYSSKERRIECKDCDQQVDGFDAFMVLCAHFHSMESASRSREARTKEALGAVIIRRAAKAFDKAWGRKMAPCCPHCRGGLLPEDFANGAASSMGQEFEIARRKRPTTPTKGSASDV